MIINNDGRTILNGDSSRNFVKMVILNKDIDIQSEESLIDISYTDNGFCVVIPDIEIETLE